ncbi:kinase-like domain-containing protein [Phlebopus sp. FC_14]|nr:kinase-like domain-containing protein [Phlebopus sp. FC_14]
MALNAPHNFLDHSSVSVYKFSSLLKVVITSSDCAGKKFKMRSTNLPDLTEYVMCEEAKLVGQGAYGDVYACPMRASSGDKVKVALKRIQPHDGTNTQDIDKDLRRELGIWKRLHDCNVVPLLGTVRSSEGMLPYMVSAWMPFGTLDTYLSQNLDLLTVTDRLRLLEGIASGLQYRTMSRCQLI